MENQIIIKDLRIHARHGVNPQENIIGHDFLINVILDTDFTQAMATDDLRYTVNYASVVEVIRSEMEVQSQLLEHVGGRICRSLFSHFPTITQIELELIKLNPPFSSQCFGAGIKIIDIR